MAKVSSCGEEDGEGPSSPRPKRFRFSLQTNKFIDQNEPQHQQEEDEEEGEDETYEEEETIYEEDTDEEEQDQPENPAPDVTVGPRSTIDNTHVTPHADDGSITVTLTDPEVLDCSICLDHLSIPVFQCENGHIACSSCCIKLSNKCPSCFWPIGYNRCRAIEKVLEAVKIPCQNSKYGCKEVVTYSRKSDHEKVTPDVKPLSQFPILGDQVTKVDFDDLNEPKMDYFLMRRASFVLEEMKSASKASTSAQSGTSSPPIPQQKKAVATMKSILEQPVVFLVHDVELRTKFQESTAFLLSQPNLRGAEVLGILGMFSQSLDSILQRINFAIEHEKEIQTIQQGYNEKMATKSKFVQEVEQTVKKYEETNQDILRVEKELQRLKNVKTLTRIKLQDLLKEKETIIDSSTESNLEGKISELKFQVSKLRKAPEDAWKYLKNSFNSFDL